MKEIAIQAKSVDKVTKKETTFDGKCKQYDTVAEAIKDMTAKDTPGSGEKTVLAIVNMQVKIRALDALRKGATPSLMKMFKTASPDAQEKIKKLLGLA